MNKILDREISLVVRLEHDELNEFQKLSRDTLLEMEKTKKEIKMEERIRLNLTFVHYKLKQIHNHIQEILKLSAKTKKDPYHSELEINHVVKLILKEVLEIEKDFLPIIKKNISMLIKGESKFYAHEIQREFLGYKHIVDKLKHTFKLSSYSLSQIDRIRKTQVGRIKTKLR
jgi:hypothetical protein